MEKDKVNIILDKKIVIISVAILVTLVLSISFAYFRAQGTSAEQTITTANLNLVFGDGTAIVNATNISPIDESEILTKAAKKTFTLAKESASPNLYTDIELSNITIPTELKNYDFKWALYQGSTKLTTGNFATLGTDTSIVLATNQLINSTTAKAYSLYIWINETEKDQSTMMNKTFKGTIIATASDKQVNTLASNILKETPKTTAPTFTTTSTDKGLFVQKDDSTKSNFGFPTYYYRGAVTNNYVEFGSYTSNITNKIWDGSTEVDTVVAHTGDPIKWKIIRINEDGSIRLISEHNIGDSWHAWNSSSNADYKGSEIENTVNSWYTSKTNIVNTTNLNNKVIMGDYCSDIEDNYSGSKRIETEKKPRFTCSNEGVMIQAKAGMITGDEMIYAGTLYEQEVTNNTTYLDNRTFFWTITPYSFWDVVRWNPSEAYLDFNTSDLDREYNAAARAVINLKPNVIISGGTGTSADPYIVR